MAIVPRPPQLAPAKEIRIVLSVLAGEVTIAEAARKEGVSEVSISKWRNEFLDAGKHALAVGGSLLEAGGFRPQLHPRLR
ncbi:transposase [Streptomyces sp. NPDC079189]|uniref:transposase n=1 Tax=Streptomyces sp. NPDC079189 TaxID=3154514 RepID=UPI0034457390